MANTNSLKPLIKQRGTLRSQLTRLNNFLISHENLEISTLEIRKIKLEEIYSNWGSVQSEIELLDDDSNHEQEREEFENVYYQCADVISKQIYCFNSKSNSINTSSSTNTIQNLATNNQSILPKINIKQFNGNFLEWNSFYDTFKTLVNDNTAIPAVHKFHLLKSYLIDDAAAVIDSLNSSEENYLVAWNLLQKRFNNPRKIIHCHIRALFELPEVSKDSASATRSLAERAEMHVNALKALDQPVNWHEMLIYIVSSKLDKSARTLWERSIDDGCKPTFSEFLTFINKLSRDSEPVSLLHKSHEKSRFQNSHDKFINNKGKRQFSQSYNTIQINKCAICLEIHSIHGCPKFLALSPQQRLESTKKAKLCINCLKRGHTTTQCYSSSCKKCNAKHNTLLHFNNSNTLKESINDSQKIQEPSTSAFTSTYSHHEILLSTARIFILDSENNAHECRALLDAGSQSNFITERLASKLNLPKNQINLPTLGIGQSKNIVKHCIKATITDKKRNTISSETFLILPIITASLPSKQINRKELNIPKNIILADPYFHKPSEIDILLGEYIFYKLLSVGQIRLSNNTAILQKTSIGWLISGKVNHESRTSSFCHNVILNLDQKIERFWQIEEVCNKKHFSAEEKLCESHFNSNVRRNDDGSYTVRLPFNNLKNKLGNSYKIALTRFYNLEKRFKHNLELKNNYCAFMNEYNTLGHMTEVEDTDPSKLLGFFLPHHPVVKENSLTTKIRVVFDGSAKSETGISLNETLMVGPTLQDDIFSLITRFRTHVYALTADIEKMYRQVQVNKDDTQYQKILWRCNDSEQIKVFKLNTVTYGTSSAPFLAVRSLLQLADDEKYRYPLGSLTLKNDFYVDDLLTGASTLDETLNIKNELIQICSLGGFKLRKWGSNEPSLLENIKQTSPDEVHLCLDINTENKTLGVYWDQSNDLIKYRVSFANEISKTITKRKILSEISQLFDPLGLLGPVIVKAKLFMQFLWKHKLSWDESVPQFIDTKWRQFRSELPNLNKFSAPRCVTSTNVSNLQLHGFCDASEKAYGACIYIRTVDKFGKIKCQLVCAKSRVAPLKIITLPRLELCAAVLLTNLFKSVKNSIKLKFNSVRFWSDSTIVLNWINTSPHLLKTFVSNRVSDIQQITTSEDWFHILSKDNPADYISRGQTTTEFIQNSHWLHGPSWLSLLERSWPISNIQLNIEVPEKRSIITMVTHNEDSFQLLKRFSSFQKLCRTVAYILRFYLNSSKKAKLSGSLTVAELETSHFYVIRLVQSEAFTKEIQNIKNNQPISNKSRILSLNPFIDNNRVLRVGGRLKNSNLSYTSKHPILLPKNHHITKLIIMNEHIKHLHAGVQATLNAVRQRYWPIDGKNSIRFLIGKCIKCFRAKPTSVPEYLMADLPKARFNATKPFENVGIDYCGPFFIKEKEHRNLKKLKAYVAVFVCFLTKAVHLELVNNLTTESCLASIRRFIARRGTCKLIHSDNATNFVGANNYLKELLVHTSSTDFNNIVANELATKGIQWQFSPARSPHFGGLWEAAVKSFKFHFIRVVGDTLFTYEQLYTYVVEIEYILNSRPLTPLSSDPNDLTPLTPNHFLIGESTEYIPENNFLEMKTNRLSAWQHIQKLRQTFWRRWYKEYLNQLTIRNKWRKQGENSYKIGMLVVLKDDNQPPLHWCLGRITAVHPGADNIVRVISVKTKSGIYTRNVRNVCVLPIEADTYKN